MGMGLSSSFADAHSQAYRDLKKPGRLLRFWYRITEWYYKTGLDWSRKPGEPSRARIIPPTAD